MKIKFFLPYNTQPGQNIYVSGSLGELGNFETGKAIPMHFSNGIWICEVLFDNTTSFNYSYFLKDDYSGLLSEAGPARTFLPGKFLNYNIHDQWRPFSDESPFLSNAFRNVFYKSAIEKIFEPEELIISCSANNISENESIIISGNAAILGKWDENNAFEMSRGDKGIWYASFLKRDFSGDIEYKFIVKSKKGNTYNYKWEEGLNRQISEVVHKSPANTSVIINNFSLNLSAGKPKFSGTAIPVFSIRTNDGCGIGEFSSLKKLADLLFVTRQRVLQILPVNDTTMSHTWTDSYPYGAISIFALHPLYVNLKEIGLVEDKTFMKYFKEESARLDALEEIDYDSVDKLKWDYIKRIFLQAGDKTMDSIGFKNYFEANKSWLIPYAAFCYLRDKYNTPKFDEWPEYSRFDPTEIGRLTSPDNSLFREISIHYFLQYHLHLQLEDAHKYANSRGIILKGDIPIGINRNSVEAWSEPHYFNFSGQAGAPPDDFSVKGQNWGFPTYNWDIMEKDGYSWWKKRFRKMEEYFDAYRIDHILGFFRIWEIPSHAVEGLPGCFNPSLPFTADEIRAMGYSFNYERDCTPYIREWVLDELFGQSKKDIKDQFLDSIGWDSYRLKSNFGTQISIENYFNENPSHHLINFKESLFSLVTEVLFIQDPSDSFKYHPRISAQFTKSYQALDSSQKDSFNKIYNYFFYHRNDGYWYNNAMKKLHSLISSTGMLVCGEDLGMIPSCVPSAMSSLSILSLEIQRMPKDPKVKFGDTEKYPYLSVCTTGTHDTSTLRGWWEENKDVTSSFYKEVINGSGNAPHFCEPWICREIMLKHLNSMSMLAIFPLQDWLSIFPTLRREDPSRERINIPSNPKHYWRYRMHIKTEDLISDNEFVTEVKKMVVESSRD